MTFYVYELIDPRNNQPFYIGKGSGNRAYYHLSLNAKHLNIYKENLINKIRENNLEPIVNIIEYFENESDAYSLETELIKKYKRKGYDEGGILTNICLDNKPPNHKDKTYVAIYGSEERAQEQIDKRRKLQLERGGYGPKKHTEETKKKISDGITGSKNPMYNKKHTDETRKKISIANKGKLIGSNNPNARIYKATSPDKEVFILQGTVKRFCELKDLSYATATKIIRTQISAKSGNLKGWMISPILEEDISELSNYILVNNNFFEGFKL